MSTKCNNCGSPIDWDNKVREELHWRGPLNPDKTIHKCKLEQQSQQQPQQIQQQQQTTNHTHTNDAEIAALKTRVLKLETWIKRFSESAMMNL
jgi:hypothetical protein